MDGVERPVGIGHHCHNSLSRPHQPVPLHQPFPMKVRSWEEPRFTLDVVMLWMKPGDARSMGRITDHQIGFSRFNQQELDLSPMGPHGPWADAQDGTPLGWHQWSIEYCSTKIKRACLYMSLLEPVTLHGQVLSNVLAKIKHLWTTAIKWILFGGLTSK